MSCPICVSPEGSAITEGIRAGAGVLILVTAMILGAIVRFGYRLWAADCVSRAAEGSENTEMSVAAHD
jgi:predicted negative regulator of RcsB-dependent stress response